MSIPVTRTRTSYTLTLHATSGKRRGVIGAVHELSYDQGMQVEDLFEVDGFAKGLPRELVPQILSSRTLKLARYDLYTATIEQIFGRPELITLADQLGPVSLRMIWKDPEPQLVVDPSTVGVTNIQNFLPIPALHAYEFTDCFITSLGRTISTQNRIVGANATLNWRSIRQLA